MSSSAPKRQLTSEPSLFAYADAQTPGAAPANSADGGQSNSSSHSHFNEEQSRRQQAEAFERERQNAQQQHRSELDAAVAKHRSEVGRILREFALERQKYYSRIEGEVVVLSIAIARKILHREVQIDPQALAGIVRVTLEKLDAGTKVNLRVHPKEATDWRHYFACQIEDTPAPEIHEDPSIAAGECRIETSLGSTEVGLERQLKEIETGLLDLLAERPGGPMGSSPNSATANSVSANKGRAV